MLSRASVGPCIGLLLRSPTGPPPGPPWDPPRGPLEAPKRPPRGPQEAPKRPPRDPQEAFKRPPRGPKGLQEASRGSKRLPLAYCTGTAECAERLE